MVELNDGSPLPVHIDETISSIARLRAEHRENATPLQRVLDRMAKLLVRPQFIGAISLIIGGWIAYGLVYLGFGLSHTGWQVWALYGLYGIYYAASEGSAKALIADLVTPDRRGTAYGLYNAAIGLTAFPASAIAGLLWQGAFGWHGFGPSAPFLFGAVLALLAGILFWALVRVQKKPAEQSS